LHLAWETGSSASGDPLHHITTKEIIMSAKTKKEAAGEELSAEDLAGVAGGMAVSNVPGLAPNAVLNIPDQLMSQPAIGAALTRASAPAAAVPGGRRHHRLRRSKSLPATIAPGAPAPVDARVLGISTTVNATASTAGLPPPLSPIKR
jgi:hypothetical protein